MATITLEVPDELAQRLEDLGERLPELLDNALKVSDLAENQALDLSMSVWKEVIEFLGSAPEPQQIIEFKISEVAQERVENILFISSAGELTPEESKELESFIQVDHFFILLKAYLRQALLSLQVAPTN